MNLVEQLKSVLPKTLVENLSQEQKPMNEASEESQKLATMLKPYKDPNVLGDGIGLHLADIYLDKNKMQQFTNMIHALVFTASQNLDSSKKKLLAREFKDVTWLLESKETILDKRKKYLNEWLNDDIISSTDTDILENNAIRALFSDYPLFVATAYFCNVNEWSQIANMLFEADKENYTENLKAIINTSFVEDDLIKMLFSDKELYNPIEYPLYTESIFAYAYFATQILLLRLVLQDSDLTAKVKDSFSPEIYRALVQHFPSLAEGFLFTNDPKSKVKGDWQVSDIKDKSGKPVLEIVKANIKKFNKSYDLQDHVHLAKKISQNIGQVMSMSVSEFLDLTKDFDFDYKKLYIFIDHYSLKNKSLADIKHSVLTNPLRDNALAKEDYNFITGLLNKQNL